MRTLFFAEGGPETEISIRKLINTLKMIRLLAFLRENSLLFRSIECETFPAIAILGRKTRRSRSRGIRKGEARPFVVSTSASRELRSSSKFE